jgi:acetyl esterase
MPLDPQVRRYLDQQAALGAPPQREIPPTVQRANQRAARVLHVTERQIPGPGGAIPLRIFTPAGPKPWPVLVYFHGGGWVIGDLDVTDLRCRLLADWGRCLVVSVYYRHAPEHRFPAAIDDSYAATLWTAEHASELGADADRLAVCGDSAGGNLAAAVALMARESGPRIMFQNLVYPVVDHDFSRTSYIENAAGFGLSQDTMRWYWDQYVPDEAQRNDPFCSPFRAENLSGLPPAFIQTAEFDPLRDEGEAYAARLRAAGVPVLLKRYDGVIHGFVGQAGEFDIGKQAVIDAVTVLREAFSKS